MRNEKFTTFEETVSYFKKELDMVERTIEKNFITDVSLIPTIGKYLNDNGGKRIRPLLLLTASKICGYNNGNRHVTYSCIVEFIHLATLLHDDVLDDAKIRRGKESANVKWGNKASVLVADYLFAKSFVLMAEDKNHKIFDFMSKATKDMVEGETLQLMNIANMDTSEDQYFDAINRKTAILFSSSCKIGSVLGNASAEQEKALHGFGEHVGLAFQLIDDVLDYFADKKRFGKQPGQDLSEGKVTLPLIHLNKHASAKEKKLMALIVRSKKENKDNFNKIVALMEKYGSREYTIKEAKKHVKAAKTAIKPFKDSKYSSALYAIADYVTERDL